MTSTGTVCGSGDQESGARGESDLRAVREGLASGCVQKGGGDVGLLPNLAMEVVAHLEQHAEGLLMWGAYRGPVCSG